MQTIYDPSCPANDNRRLALAADNTAQKHIQKELAETIGRLRARGQDPAAMIEELYRQIVALSVVPDWSVSPHAGDIRLDRYLQLSRISGDLNLRSLGLFALDEVDAHL